MRIAGSQVLNDKVSTSNPLGPVGFKIHDSRPEPILAKPDSILPREEIVPLVSSVGILPNGFQHFAKIITLAYIDYTDTVSPAFVEFSSVTFTISLEGPLTTKKGYRPIMLSALILKSDTAFWKKNVEVLTAEPLWMGMLNY